MLSLIDALSFLIDLLSLIVVLVPVLCTHIAASYMRNRHWSEIWLVMGIPLGLLASIVGATNMALFSTDFKSIYPASAIMLLTVLYGSVISMLGYFARQEKQPQTINAISTAQLIILLAVLWALFVGVMARAGIGAYLSIEAAVINLSVIGASLFLSAKPNYTDTICEAALIGAGISVVIGVIAIYSAPTERDAAIQISMNGLTYGLLIYISTYFFSLKYPTGVEVSFTRLNWHWMEIVTFLVFMLFSTETIREYLKNGLAT